MRSHPKPCANVEYTFQSTKYLYKKMHLWAINRIKKAMARFLPMDVCIILRTFAAERVWA